MTSADNLSALCKRHHLAKHQAGWRLHRQFDGTYSWTAPTGHQYRSGPQPYRDIANEDPAPF